MVRKALSFVGSMTRDFECYGQISAGNEDCLLQVDRFREFQLCLLRDMKDQVIADIREQLTRQDTLEIVVWFYLSMTD